MRWHIDLRASRAKIWFVTEMFVSLVNVKLLLFELQRSRRLVYAVTVRTIFYVCIGFRAPHIAAAAHLRQKLRPQQRQYRAGSVIWPDRSLDLVQ